MKVVLDTNTFISGLFWKGAPRQILDLARNGFCTLVTSPDLLAELADVLSRDKFAERMVLAEVESDELVHGYAALARAIRSMPIRLVIHADPDDDKVLGCAKAAKTDVIISGDGHLFTLGEFEGIPIVQAGKFLEQFG